MSTLCSWWQRPGKASEPTTFQQIFANGQVFATPYNMWSWNKYVDLSIMVLNGSPQAQFQCWANAPTVNFAGTCCSPMRCVTKQELRYRYGFIVDILEVVTGIAGGSGTQVGRLLLRGPPLVSSHRELKKRPRVSVNGCVVQEIWANRAWSRPRANYGTASHNL